MKRKFIVIPAIVFLSLVTAVFAARLFFIFLAEKELKKIFPESKVSVNGCSFYPLGWISFSGIKVKNSPLFDIQIAEAGAGHNLVYLKDAQISVNSSKNILPELLRHSRLAPSQSIPFKIGKLELENVRLKVGSADLGIQGVVSLQADLLNRSLDYCQLKSDLNIMGLQFKNILLNVKAGIEGDFSIEELSYKKGKIRDAKSSVWLKKEGLFFDSLSLGIFGAAVKGDLSLRTDKAGEYLTHLKFTDLDLGVFISDFELEKKLLLEGKVSGDITLGGNGSVVKILSGKFHTLEPGGMLAVIDAELLKNLAQRSGKALNILVEGFKNYRYNVGVMAISLDNGDLTLGIDLAGEQGKRNLTVVVHDFKLWRGKL